MALIGFPTAGTAKPDPTADDAIVFNVTTANFETAVLQASMHKPILIDFWAPWCGPCKQLTPTLEACVRGAQGAVLLAKVNIDECPDLAQAFRVQSVPMVMALFQGRPVTGFVGAQPESEIRRLIDHLAKMGGGQDENAPDIAALMEQAANALAQKDYPSAQELYATILAHDAMNGAAYSGLVRVMIAAGDLDQAQDLIDAASDDMRAHKDFAAALSALHLARQAPAQDELARLAERVAHDPADQSARIDLAVAQFAAGAREAAIDTLIESLRRDRGWNDGQARQQLLQFFEAMGPADPLTSAGRRKLSSVLFS